jgi:hypothetical protein
MIQEKQPFSHSAIHYLSINIQNWTPISIGHKFSQALDVMFAAELKHVHTLKEKRIFKVCLEKEIIMTTPKWNFNYSTFDFLSFLAPFQSIPNILYNSIYFPLTKKNQQNLVNKSIR